MGNSKIIVLLLFCLILFSPFALTQPEQKINQTLISTNVQINTVYAHLYQIQAITSLGIDGDAAIEEQRDVGSPQPIPGGGAYSVQARTALPGKKLNFSIRNGADFIPIQDCQGLITDSQGWAQCRIDETVFESLSVGNRSCYPIKVEFKGEEGLSRSEAQTSICSADGNPLSLFGTALESAIQSMQASPRGFLCIPIFLILGVLLASMYYSGKNPMMLFDITTPRLPRGKRGRISKTILRSNLLAKLEMDKRLTRMLDRFAGAGGLALLTQGGKTLPPGESALFKDLQAGRYRGKRIDPAVRGAAMLAFLSGKSKNYVIDILEGGHARIRELAEGQRSGANRDLESMDAKSRSFDWTNARMGNDNRSKGVYSALYQAANLSVLQAAQMKAVGDTYGFSNPISRGVHFAYRKLWLKHIPFVGKAVLALGVDFPAEIKNTAATYGKYFKSGFVETVNFASKFAKVGRRTTGFFGWIQRNSIEGKRIGSFEDVRGRMERMVGDLYRTTNEDLMRLLMREINKGLQGKSKDERKRLEEGLSSRLATHMKNEKYLFALRELLAFANDHNLKITIRDRSGVVSTDRLIKLCKQFSSEMDTHYKRKDHQIGAEEKAIRAMYGYIMEFDGRKDGSGNPIFENGEQARRGLLYVASPLYDRGLPLRPIREQYASEYAYQDALSKYNQKISTLQNSIIRMADYLRTIEYLKLLREFDGTPNKIPTYNSQDSKHDATAKVNDMIKDDFKFGAYKWASIREFLSLQVTSRSGLGRQESGFQPHPGLYAETMRLLAERIEGRIHNHHNTMYRHFAQTANENFATLKFYQKELLPLMIRETEAAAGRKSTEAREKDATVEDYKNLMKKGITWSMAMDLKWNANDSDKDRIGKGEVIKGWISTSDKTFRPLFYNGVYGKGEKYVNGVLAPGQGTYQKFIQNDGLNFEKALPNGTKQQIDRFGASVADKYVSVLAERQNLKDEAKHVWSQESWHKRLYLNIQQPVWNVVMGGMYDTVQHLETAFAMQAMQRKAFSDFERAYKAGDFFSEAKRFSDMREAIGKRSLDVDGSKSASENFRSRLDTAEQAATNANQKKLLGQMLNEGTFYENFQMRQALKGVSKAESDRIIASLKPLSQDFERVQDARKDTLTSEIKLIRNDATFGKAFRQVFELSRQYNVLFPINESSFMRDPRAASSSYGIQQSIDVGYHTGQSLYEPRHYVQSHGLMPGEWMNRTAMFVSHNVARMLSSFTRAPMALSIGYPPVYDFGRMDTKRYKESIRSLVLFWENWDRLSNLVIPRFQNPLRYGEEGWSLKDVDGGGKYFRMPVTLRSWEGIPDESKRRMAQTRLQVDNYNPVFDAGQERDRQNINSLMNQLISKSEAVGTHDRQWYDRFFEKGKYVNLLLTGKLITTGPERERTYEKESLYYMNVMKPYPPGMMHLEWNEAQHLNPRLSSQIEQDPHYGYLAGLYPGIGDDTRKLIWRRDRMPIDGGYAVDPVYGGRVESLADQRKQEYSMYEFGIHMPFFLGSILAPGSKRMGEVKKTMEEPEKQEVAGQHMSWLDKNYSARMAYYYGPYGFNMQSTFIFPGLALATWGEMLVLNNARKIAHKFKDKGHSP